MAALSITEFNEFMASTGPYFYTGTETRVNDAAANNSRTLGYMMRGQNMADVVQSGSQIKDQIMLSNESLMHEYKPLQSETPSIVETGTTWTVNWRFALNPMSWTDQTVGLNAGIDMNSSAKKEAYKNLWRNMMQNLRTSEDQFWETVAWRKPNKAEMETASGGQFASIPTIINEHTNGLFKQGSNDGGTWTTVQGIDPTTSGQTTWVPTQRIYSSGEDSGFELGSPKNILAGLDLVFLDTDFEPPAHNKQYYDEPSSLQSPGAFIACSKTGLASLMFVYRESKDRWVDMKDPFGKPTYAGAPIVYIQKLDAAQLYSISTTHTGTETTADVAGPRYYGIQPKYLRFVWHKERYMTPLGVLTDREQPTVHTQNYDTWGNLVARSRRKHFILYPDTPQTGLVT